MANFVKISALIPGKKLVNRILNYYILIDKGPDLSKNVFTSSFFLDKETFVKVLNEENIKRNIPSYHGDIIHLCHDLQTHKIYIPDSLCLVAISEGKKNTINHFLKLISKKYGVEFNEDSIIIGDPYWLFRIRNVTSFPSTARSKATAGMRRRRCAC